MKNQVFIEEPCRTVLCFWKDSTVDPKVKKSTICEFLLKLKINDCRTNIYRTGFCPFQTCTKKEERISWEFWKFNAVAQVLRFSFRIVRKFTLEKWLQLTWSETIASALHHHSILKTIDHYFSELQMNSFIFILLLVETLSAESLLTNLKLYHQFNIGMFEIIAFFLSWFIFLSLRLEDVII